MTSERIEDEPVEFLDHGTCWRLLRSVEVGRLAMPTPYGGVDIFPVNHLVDQGSIVFRTALGSKLTHATDAQEVAFEIDGQGATGGDDAGTAWSVVIHGRAELIRRDTTIFDSFELDVRPWHLSHKPFFVRVTPTSVTGRRFHVNRTDPTADARSASRSPRPPTSKAGDDVGEEPTMVQHLIVPIDGSDASWRAVDVAVALGARCDATVEVVEVIDDQADVATTRAALEERLAQHDGATATASVPVAVDVAATLEALVDEHPEAMIVMSSHGRGRSAALLGSVTEELLRRSYGPMLVVGPHAEAAAFDGPVIATVDGSSASEFGLPLAAAWGIELGGEPWIIQVAEPDVASSADAGESAYIARLARRLAKDSSHPVEFEVLHGHDVAAEVADFARSIGATMIVATTHGRTGLPRFVVGSTAAAMVRHAPCSVLLLRPPHLTPTQ